MQTIAGLSEAVKQAVDDAQLATVHAEGHDGDWIRAQLMEQIQAADADRTWLFISKIEEVLGAAARVLNGAREQLAGYAESLCSFARTAGESSSGSCPDLMDWVGLRICLAHQLSPRLGLKDDRRIPRADWRRSTDCQAVPLWQIRASCSPSRRTTHGFGSELLTIRSELSTPEVSEQ